MAGHAVHQHDRADRGGHALYANLSIIPHITDQQVRDCVVPGVGSILLEKSRLPVLDGSRPACGLGSDPDAVQPGIFGPRHLPRLERADYVRNSNDPPWLADPRQPITGYPYVTNDTSHDIRLRSRLGIAMVEGRLTGADGYGPRGFTIGLMQRLVLNDRNLSAELARAAMVDMCRQHPTLIASDSQPIDVRTACLALKAWDLRADSGSRGEALWKELWLRVLQLPTPIWRRPFDPAHPLDTPTAFAATSPDVQRTFADAVEYLAQHHIVLDARYGDVQGVNIGGRHIPLPGCQDPEGCFNVIGFHRDYHHIDGYANIDQGSSSIQVTGWNDAGQPVSRTILTYSQSANPASPNASDQTELFSRKQWVAPPWTQVQVARAAGTDVTVLHYRSGRYRPRLARAFVNAPGDPLPGHEQVGTAHQYWFSVFGVDGRERRVRFGCCTSSTSTAARSWECESLRRALRAKDDREHDE